MEFDWVNLAFALIVLAIAYSIYRTIKQTRAKIEKKLGPAPSEMAMKQLYDQIKNKELPKCPECGGESFAMIDADYKYKCDSCHHEFEGAAHL